MKKICFFTGTRADYGIMAPIMRGIQASSMAELQIVATNMHLSRRYGMTVEEIEKDGFVVNKNIPTLEDSDSRAAIVRSMGLLQEQLADAFDDLQPDMIVILGDRYEALAAASAAVVYGIPIVHLHGGEITEGAMDDMFRNAITKLSTYHFASTPEYASRIISMGEKPENVFHSGAPGAEFSLDNDETVQQDFMKKTGLEAQDRFMLLAMHPATLSPDKGVQDVEATIGALDSFIDKGYKILITMPNSDPGNSLIRKLFETWHANRGQKVITVDSLGSRLFRYAMSTAELMIGNSSAALIEAPSLRLPAVDVGDRQKGRASGISVIHSEGDKEMIEEKIWRALSPGFRKELSSQPIHEINPYFKNGSSEFIIDKLISL